MHLENYRYWFSKVLRGVRVGDWELGKDTEKDAERGKVYAPKTRSFPRFFDIRWFMSLPANSHLWCSDSAPATKLSISKNRSTLYRFWGIYLSSLSCVLAKQLKISVFWYFFRFVLLEIRVIHPISEKVGFPHMIVRIIENNYEDITINTAIITVKKRKQSKTAVKM